MSVSKLTMIRPLAPFCLVPYGDVAGDVLETVPRNKLLIVSIHQTRNPKHFNLFWALAARVANFHPEFLDARDAVRWAQRRLGMFKRFHEADGSIWCEYESLAVESMDQLEFKSFFDRCLDAWAEEIGCDPMELLPPKQRSED